MKLEAEQVLCRCLRRAREAHLAGATVLKGPMGYGKNSRVHSAKLLELTRP